MKPEKKSNYFARTLRDNAWSVAAAVVLAFLVSCLFIFSLDVSPIQSFLAIVSGAFGSAYGLAEVLAKAIPLIIVGLGVTLAFKGGMSNLGGDGQFYMGAMAAVLVGLYATGLPFALRMIVAFAAAAAAGGVWGGIAGWMKAHLNTSEVIITIMMNYVALYFIGYLINGPFKAPGGIPQTRALEAGLEFAKLKTGTRAHTGLFVALALVALTWWMLSKTVLGYKIQTVGVSHKAAGYAGIPTGRYCTMIMVLSGAFAGVAGMVEVYGVHYRVLEGISASFGFTAVLVSLLARLHPVGVIIGSLAVSVLSVGANAMQITMAVPTAIATVIQSLIIFFMLITPAAGDKLAKAIRGKASKKRGDA